MDLNFNLYFVRHGYALHNQLADANNEHAYDIFEPPLVESGIEQIKALKTYMRNNNINIDSVYCSPLLRCIQTSDILFNNQTINLDDKLLEHENISQLCNKRDTLENINAKIVQFTNNTYNMRNVNKSYYFNNETETMFKLRIMYFFISLITYLFNNKIKNVNICIISHLNWIKMFYKIFNIDNINFTHGEIRLFKINPADLNYIRQKYINLTQLMNESKDQNVEKIRQILDKLKTLNRKLELNEIQSIIRFNYNDVECNYDLILSILRKITELEPTIDLAYYLKSTNYNSSQATIMFIYFKILKYYFDKNFIVFSFGDSLDKLNSMWNLMNDEHHRIKNVPFSGNMYLANFEVKQTNYENMIQLFETMLENNPMFRDLVNRLRTGTDNIVITDFMSHGTSLITLLELFKLKNINTTKLHYHYLTYNDNIDNIKEKIEEYKDTFNISNIKIHILDNVLDRYFTNSEDYNSRCVPKYSYQSWIRPVRETDVYIDGTNPNYFNCNVHTLIFYLVYLCFYNKFIIKYIDNTDPEFNNEMILEQIIKGFFDKYYDFNKLEGVIDTFEKKYLKYKYKYILLKNKKKL